MENKHDFKGVLSLSAGVWKDRSFIDDEIETIQAALRIADKLASGEVSEGMLKAGYEKDKLTLRCSGTIFKAMAAQMIKEIE